jgi:hypothetical protein
VIDVGSGQPNLASTSIQDERPVEASIGWRDARLGGGRRCVAGCGTAKEPRRDVMHPRASGFVHFTTLNSGDPHFSHGPFPCFSALQRLQ